jgi:phosphatidylglycerol:prolipoprotein diacylglycerol transferase
MNHLIIDNQNGGLWYSLFYGLACLTVLSIFIITAIRNKYPVAKLLLIAAAGTFFFLLGTKILAIAPQDWKNFLNVQQISGQGGKTVLGGLAGLLVGSILIVRWLKTDYRVFDYLAVGLPLGMAVNRLGCLFAGCCFGKPSGLPWAICYTEHSRAFHAQLTGGLVDQYDLLSLPVHPTQLYDILSCLLIAFIVWKCRRFWKATGSRLIFAIMLYASARFFIEFFRDPVTDPYTSGLFLGIKVIQWLMVASVIILAGIIFLREKFLEINTTHITGENVDIRRPFSLLIFMMICYVSLHGVLDIIEQTICLFLLIPPVIIYTWKMLGYLFNFRYRIRIAFVSILCLVLMSQTFIPNEDGTKVRFFEGGAAGILGNYKDFTGTAYQGTDCDGDTYYAFENVKYFKYDYQLLGMNISYHERLGQYKRFSVFLSGYWGTENSQLMDSNVTTTINIYTINPGISYSWKNAGIDIGFHAGNFSFAHIRGENNNFAEKVYHDNDDRQPNHTYQFMPQFGLRLGPQNIIYADGQYGNSYPYSSPLMKFSAGIGSGLGKWDGTKLGLGFCPGGLYLLTTIPVRDRLVIHALFVESFTHGTSNRFNFTFALNYRFGFKTTSRY